jgi:ubiquitin-like-conjugating enzyme ATG3
MSLLNKFHKAREWATPTLKDSAFLTRGVLTPEEFVMAGDELVYKCPTWAWESGNPKKRKKYLPDDKQFLVTRNVPCPTRASTLENSVAIGEEQTAKFSEECGDDDWLVSRVISPEEQQQRMDEKLVEEFDILDMDDEGGDGDEKAKAKETAEDAEVDADMATENEDNAEEATATATAPDEVVEEEDEYADMEEFEDENVIEDEAAVPAGATGTMSNTDKNADSADDNIVKTRTYDMSITYDKYYQTPRIFLMGFSSDAQPLTGEQMLDDVMSDYANRTVTIDPHPHTSGPHASIHPCQHGAVMKTIVRNLTKSAEEGVEASGKPPSVEMYLFIFLKFVSSIVPTITYDFTMDVTASTEK